MLNTIKYLNIEDEECHRSKDDNLERGEPLSSHFEQDLHDCKEGVSNDSVEICYIGVGLAEIDKSLHIVVVNQKK